MNQVSLIGRIVANLELKKSKSGLVWTRFTIAINSGEEVDFINVVAYEKIAETTAAHMKKGSQVGIQGRIKTGQFEHEKGVKINTFDIVASRIKFLDNKEKQDGYHAAPDGATDDLPF